MTDRSQVVSSFTVIKGALVSETYEAFRHWDFAEDKRANIARLKEENVFGASSQNWLRDVGKVLNRRFEPRERDRPLAELAEHGMPLEKWRPLLLWHMTRDEFLVRDFLVNWLQPKHESGVFQLGADDVEPYLNELAERGLTQDGKPWSRTTRRRVATGLLQIATDMELLTEGARKQFRHFHLPEESFLYILHAIAEDELNGARILESEEWHMYLYDAQQVEAEVLRLHQFRHLEFHRAGTVVSLDLPYANAAEYAESLRS